MPYLKVRVAVTAVGLAALVAGCTPKEALDPPTPIGRTLAERSDRVDWYLWAYLRQCGGRPAALDEVRDGFVMLRHRLNLPTFETARFADGVALDVKRRTVDCTVVNQRVPYWLDWAYKLQRDDYTTGQEAQRIVEALEGEVRLVALASPYRRQ